jgi:hypothetical protein
MEGIDGSDLRESMNASLDSWPENSRSEEKTHFSTDIRDSENKENSAELGKTETGADQRDSQEVENE